MLTKEEKIKRAAEAVSVLASSPLREREDRSLRNSSIDSAELMESANAARRRCARA